MESTKPTPVPTAPSAFDRLESIYRSPRPYTSVYLPTRPLLPGRDDDLARRWRELRADLEVQCAPPEALAAIDARLALPAPPDTAAVAVVAAADGSTIVDHGMEPPKVDFGVVDTLPYVGPMLEWHQRRIPHVVVTVDGAGADIVTFGPDHYAHLEEVQGTVKSLTPAISEAAEAVGARVIVVGGAPRLAQQLAERVNVATAPSCRVLASLEETADELGESTVRQVSDEAARTTVGLLRELRFLAAHDADIEGTHDTIGALRSGVPGVLLIHDDPQDRRRVWVGKLPFRLSGEETSECREQARFVDAAIWSAVMQGIDVHIIPRTGRNGPAADTALVDRRAVLGGDS
jgi:hypothetical protein